MVVLHHFNFTDAIEDYLKRRLLDKEKRISSIIMDFSLYPKAYKSKMPTPIVTPYSYFSQIYIETISVAVWTWHPEIPRDINYEFDIEDVFLLYVKLASISNNLRIHHKEPEKMCIEYSYHLNFCPESFERNMNLLENKIYEGFVNKKKEQDLTNN